MRNRLFLFLVLFVVAGAVTAQTTDPVASRVNEAINNFALLADTYTVAVDNGRQMRLELATGGEEFLQKTVQRTALEAAVREFPDGSTNASGELTTELQQTEREPDGETMDAAQVFGALRLVDDTLFVNLDASGTTGSMVPRGWTTLVEDFAEGGSPDGRFAFEFAGRDELAIEELLGFREDSDYLSRDTEFLAEIIELADATNVSTEVLSDGSPVELLSVELVGPRVLEIESFADEILDSTADVPPPFLDALFENMVLRMGVRIDQGELFRGFSLDMRFLLESDDLQSVLGEMVPPDALGSILIDMRISEETTYTDINADFPPVRRPSPYR
jgi:hypothetical protein